MGELSRVTVVGARKRVDVAVPASTPIGEYVDRLARMCEQERDAMLPPAWSLAVAGGSPLPLGRSLSELGVDDGQVLYLSDSAQEPGPAPLVEDLDELVADETVTVRRRMVRGGSALIVFSLVWMAVGAAWLTLRVPSTATAVGLALSGLLLIGIAWGLSQRARSVPRGLRLAVALTSVPCMAAAGGLIGVIVGGLGGWWAGLVTGANVAALMTLAALADQMVAAVALQLSGATVLWMLTGYAGATRLQALAVAVLASVGFTGPARRLAAAMVAWSSGSTRRRHTAAEAAAELVHESGRLLTVLLVLPAAILVVGLPMLAMSGNVFALALAVIVSAGLLARARLSGFSVELCVLSTGGLAGAFGAVAATLQWAAVSAATQTGLFVSIALALLGGGVALSLYGPNDPTKPNPARAPRKRTRAEVLAAVATIATIPLTMGVFGVFSRLVGIGRHLF